MSNTFNINDGSVNKRVFYTSGTDSFQTWQKPLNAKFVHFFVLGSGSGGGGGASGGSGTARRGGGSGASGGHVIAAFPASQIPDTLFINVATGGIGGNGGGSGTTGATKGANGYRGSGGGGGGSTLNTFASGAGGVGGNGYVCITAIG
jgi:hypothetical protein